MALSHPSSLKRYGLSRCLRHRNLKDGQNINPLVEYFMEENPVRTIAQGLIEEPKF